MELDGVKHWPRSAFLTQDEYEKFLKMRSQWTNWPQFEIIRTRIGANEIRSTPGKPGGNDKRRIPTVKNLTDIWGRPAGLEARKKAAPRDIGGELKPDTQWLIQMLLEGVEKIDKEEGEYYKLLDNEEEQLSKVYEEFKKYSSTKELNWLKERIKKGFTEEEEKQYNFFCTLVAFVIDMMTQLSPEIKAKYEQDFGPLPALTFSPEEGIAKLDEERISKIATQKEDIMRRRAEAAVVAGRSGGHRRKHRTRRRRKRRRTRRRRRHRRKTRHRRRRKTRRR